MEKIQATYTLKEDTKFGAAIVEASPEDLKAAGFELGDSIDLEFSNGKKYYDVPYHNGYYVSLGMMVIVAYPGLSTLSITKNNFGLWKQDGLSETDTVTFIMNEPKKYLAIQEALTQNYSFDRADYTSDESFCNFREIMGGNLGPKRVFRGASPIDNSRNRAPYTDKLLQKNNITFILNIADSKEDIASFISKEDFNSPYFNGLYKSNQVSLLDMSADFTSLEYKKKLIDGLLHYLEYDGPMYIHCTEGKDRTGFVCLIVAGICGASYEEMALDYLITYDNYYGYNTTSEPEKCKFIKELYFDCFMNYLLSFSQEQQPAIALTKINYQPLIRKYLLSGGMSEADIDRLIQNLTKTE